MNRKKRQRLADTVAKEKQNVDSEKGKLQPHETSRAYIEALEARIKALESALNLDIGKSNQS